MANLVQSILNGITDPDPSQHGMTTDEERTASLMPQWPGVAEPVRPPNAGLKLFGGAAFERCLNEFQEAANCLKFPSAAVARDRIANVLLAYKGKNNLGGAARAAEDIARSTARELLKPLLETACARLAFVLRRALDIAADCAMRSAPSKEVLQPYVAFHAALRTAHMAFVTRLEERAKGLLQHHLEAATGEFALSMMASLPDLWAGPGGLGGGRGGSSSSRELGLGGGELENMPPDDAGEDSLLQVALPARTPFRPSQMTVPETPSPETIVLQQQQLNVAKKPSGPGRHVSDNTPSKGRVAKAQRVDAGGGALYEGRGTYGDVLQYAERLFGRIRTAVAVQAAPTTLKAAFLDPITEDLATDVALELFARSDQDYLAMFTAAGVLAALQSKRDALHRKVEGLLKCKNEFQELAKCL